MLPTVPLGRFPTSVFVVVVFGLHVPTITVSAQSSDASAYLRSVQTVLRGLGYRVEPNGVLDGDTVLALQAAQRTCDVSPSGRVDVATVQCLRDTLRKQISKLHETLRTNEELVAVLQTPPPASLASAVLVTTASRADSTGTPVGASPPTQSVETTYVLAVQQALQRGQGSDETTG